MIIITIIALHYNIWVQLEICKFNSNEIRTLIMQTFITTKLTGFTVVRCGYSSIKNAKKF